MTLLFEQKRVKASSGTNTVSLDLQAGAVITYVSARNLTKPWIPISIELVDPNNTSNSIVFFHRRTSIGLKGVRKQVYQKVTSLLRRLRAIFWDCDDGDDLILKVGYEI